MSLGPLQKGAVSGSQRRKSTSFQPALPRKWRDLFAANLPGLKALATELDRPLRDASLPRWVFRAGACATSSSVSAEALRMMRRLVGVVRCSASLLVIIVPGRPSTAAAFTGVPFRMACINGLMLPWELGVGMREGRGTDVKDSRWAGVVECPGPGPGAEARQGVGDFEERQANSAPFSVTETTLPEPSST